MSFALWLLETALVHWRRLGSRSESFRFLHVSTDEVYGALTDEGDFTEETRRALGHPPPPPTYNIGGKSEGRNIDVVSAICDAMDHLTKCPTASSHRNLINFVPDRPGHDFRYGIDFGKLNGELGWSPKLSFETGLNATVKWYLENPAWWEPLLSALDASVRRGLSNRSA